MPTEPGIIDSPCLNGGWTEQAAYNPEPGLIGEYLSAWGSTVFLDYVQQTQKPTVRAGYWMCQGDRGSQWQANCVLQLFGNLQWGSSAKTISMGISTVLFLYNVSVSFQACFFLGNGVAGRLYALL